MLKKLTVMALALIIALASVCLFVSLRTFPVCLVMGNVTKTDVGE